MLRTAALDEPQCLTDEFLAELVDGQLTAEELARVHAHAARCKSCCELLVAVARGGLSQEVGQALPPEPSSSGWTPPEEFHEFRLVRQLGRGAMGIVYLAHDRSLDRQVAVKFIAAPEPNARARERFQTEARAIARLKHAHVVTVFRVGEIEGHPYIVSEYLTGSSLARLALPLPWRRALGLGIGLARGLAAAHRQGVLHRDLKPDNVFLTAEGEVKLLDFGLAELVDASALTGPSGVRAPAGTPRYMAPELFRGGSATPRSDLYALGLVLYELCTGTLPPRHRPGLPLLDKAQETPRPSEHAGPGHGPPLTECVPGLAPEFASIIERCLRVEPEERFASAEALCAELERLEPLHETEVLPAGNPYRGLAPFEAEHRAHFFGRDADIRAVLERLRRQPLVLVTGDSGVGKSSLCRAGILPRAAGGAIDEFRDFSTLTMEPGRRPVAALAAALAPVLGQTEAELWARLTEEQEWLGPALRKAYQEGRGLLLFVDQLEELVTLSEPAQAARFASLLGELALPAAGVHVLLAARGDFLTRVGSLPGLGDAVERALYLLRPLTPDGVREAITGPARSGGVVFESEALVQTLVEATAQGVGSLPLLQFTLAELWDRRDAARRCITRAALDEMGGVAGALSRHADGVLARLDRAEQQAARRLLGHLITAEGTRSERSEEELTRNSGEARTALRALIEGRLLHAHTEAGQSSYEIAHEALIASWSTLRRWIDEDAGQRALRQRLEEASTEWERLRRADELLWKARQLTESRALDATTLGAREQSFLRASQRAVRRQSLRRGLVALLLLLTVAGVYGALRLQEHLGTQRFISTRLGQARLAMAEGHALGQRSSTRREKALALFDGQPPAPAGTGAPQEPLALWLSAEESWGQALDEFKQAEAAISQAERALEDVLDRVHDHPEALELLLELTHERITLAEQFHRTELQAQLTDHFERLSSKVPAWRERLVSPATLELETVPPGARVELTRYVEVQGLRREEPVPGHEPFFTSAAVRLSLPAGAYHLRLTREGHAAVDLPLMLERGKPEQLRLTLPSAREVPAGYVYVPPGCFLMGSNAPEEEREFLHSAPLHRRCLREGYLIGRTEVTLGDWLTYLKTLRPEEGPRRLLETPHRDQGNSAITLRHLPDGGWSYSFFMVNGQVLEAREGEPIRYPGRSHRQEQDWRRFPLSGVSAHDFGPYLDWLASSGRLPGARLCSELEWMRAASGADDRKYPHGDTLQNDQANIDLTYGRRPDAFGPDEVGAHPASMSPFGLHDMAGNIFEIARAETQDLGEYVLLGGAWYFERVSTLIANRQAGTPTLQDARVGFRVCAALPAP